MTIGAHLLPNVSAKYFGKPTMFDEVSTKTCFLTFPDHPVCNNCLLSALSLLGISLREDQMGFAYNAIYLRDLCTVLI